MTRPWEDMILDAGRHTAEELQSALDRRNAEIARVVKGIDDGTMVMELIGDDDDY